jgi:hypothetical protein
MGGVLRADLAELYGKYSSSGSMTHNDSHSQENAAVPPQKSDMTTPLPPRLAG